MIRSYSNIPLTGDREKEAYANLGSDREKYLKIHSEIVNKINSDTNDGLLDLIAEGRTIIADAIVRANTLAEIHRLDLKN